MKLSIATNVSNSDLPRIKNILPHWISTFGDLYDELFIVHDNVNVSGRIKNLHKVSYRPDEIKEQLNILQERDSRIRVVELDYNASKEVSKYWFSNGVPLRCQNGSPMFPFVYSAHQAKNDFILKCDCDVLFYNKGFVQKAYELLNTYDIVSPPRNPLPGHTISSRGFFFKRENLYKILPLQLKKLSFIQIAARIARRQNIFDRKKYSLFFSLENMLNNAVAANIIKHYQIGKEYGNSLHIISNKEANQPYISQVIEAYEHGKWPKEQEEFSMDFYVRFWSEFI